jgi:1-acyl-sn-glycerol-3-phosphate acyltransferase
MFTRLTTSLRFWTRMLIFVVATIVFWGLMEADGLLRRKRPRIELTNRWVPRWSGFLLWVFGIKVEARGPYANDGRLYPGRDERGVGRVFIMNHRSGADIPIVFTIVEAHVISRHDLAHWPLIGAGARRIGTLFVDRSNRRSGATVLREIDKSLDAGEGVAMFPEGTAFPGDEVREFKPGAFKAAQRAGSEMIPMGIAYGDPTAYYTTESFMAHMKRIACLKRLRVAVEIGEPLVVDRESPVELKDHARERVEELVMRARSRLEGRPVMQPTPSLAGG